MNKLLLVLLIVFLIITGIIAIFLFKYNKMVKKKIVIMNIKQELDALLRSRWLLLPPFISIIRTYTIEANNYLEDLIKLKNNLYDKKNLEEKKLLNNNLDEILSKLIPKLSSNKELMSNNNYKEILNQLLTTEKEIKNCKELYDEQIRKLELQISSFPDKYIAKYSNISSKSSK